MTIKRVDFGCYHGLDHWPFTQRCRQMPYGGGFHHLRLAWDDRRRDQILKLWYRWRCRRGVHVDILYSVGHHPGKKCAHCSRPGILTRGEIVEMRNNWPTWLQAPGEDDDDEVVEEEAREEDG
jgi:hypothetical protein